MRTQPLNINDLGASRNPVSIITTKASFEKVNNNSNKILSEALRTNCINLHQMNI